MADLVIKPAPSTGNKLILQTQNETAVLTTSDSGATGLLVAPSGTKMIFNQTSAPTGWTKVTSSNDVALRVVSGTVGTGGTVAFETAFASQTIPVHELSVAELPSHYHSTNWSAGQSHTGSGAVSYNYTSESVGGSFTTSSTGSGDSHGHDSINLDVSFVDVIIATKD